MVVVMMMVIMVCMLVLRLLLRLLYGLLWCRLRLLRLLLRGLRLCGIEEIGFLRLLQRVGDVRLRLLRRLLCVQLLAVCIIRALRNDREIISRAMLLTPLLLCLRADFPARAPVYR